MTDCRNRVRLASWLLAMTAGWLPGVASSDAAVDAAAWIRSDGGLYGLSYQADIDPVTINRMHGWTLRLRFADGRPVTEAHIEVSGGMPAHDHGLPSQPRVTEALGDGRFRLQGVRFHMPGAWELVVTVETDDGRDRIVVPLVL